MDKVVYFVRHGQSEDNVAPVFQAPTSPLSETGKRQAEFIASRVAKLEFESLISSPYPRAKQTAEAISKATGKEVEYSNLFIERTKPTSIDGKPYTDEVATRTWREWETSLHTAGMRVEDGENFDDLLARADKALDLLTSRPDKSLVVVTHGFFLRTLVIRVLLGHHVSGDAFEHFHKSAQMENTGITVLKYHGGFEQEPIWRLWVYNDHSHLG